MIIYNVGVSRLCGVYDVVRGFICSLFMDILDALYLLKFLIIQRLYVAGDVDSAAQPGHEG